MRRRATGAARAGLALLLAVAALPAAAHGDLDRFGPFYAGALHPLLVPGHALALVALGLLAGQAGLRNGRHLLTALLVALGAGVALAAAGVPTPDAERIVLPLGLLAALAVVVARPLPRLPAAVLAVAVGLGVGLGTAAEANAVVMAAWARWSGAAGAVAGAFTVALLTAALADAVPARAWARTGLRIAASWLATSALLVAALAWSGKLPPGGAAQASAGDSSASTRAHDQ